jgi:D-alanyl-D-alanine carboxypeptidase/D-alanyl-D-alanine-endopeptidase (penicillin-binding protein 4)
MSHDMKKRMKIIILFTLSIVSCVKADLAKRIDGIINKSLNQQVRFSILVVKADTGETVYNHNANRPMIPASNMKVITSAAALKYLGPNYEYTTKVGICDDTLVVIGSGDPLLGDGKTDNKYGREKGWIFKDIVQTLKRNGIGTIKDIIIDSSIFDDQRVHPSWPKNDLNRWYACELSGLNYNDNCIEISAKNNRGKVSVFLNPQTSFLKFRNNVKPISRGNSVIGSYRGTEINNIIVYGKCRKSIGPFVVAIERPAAFFGFLLAENLARAGIKTTGRLIEKTLDETGDFRLLAQYTTGLNDCLARCNKNSLGLAAEALFKTIAANNNLDQKNGSWDKGRELVSEYLSKLGISKNEFYIDDASGLSDQNRLSANVLIKVLLSIYNSNDWGFYKNSLAVGGVDGSIARYFRDRKYKGKIFGKTGYISSVKTFSGVCATEKGDYIFSILANNTNGHTRTVINDIAEAIIDNASM